MKSLYREKLYSCGEYLDVDIYPVYEQPRARSRKSKYRETPDIQKKLNQRNAERKLARLLNTNFADKDVQFNLTYADSYAPETAEQAQKDVQNFLRRIKRLRKKKGLPELKYVFVTEQGKRSKRFHHHLVMNGGLTPEELARVWGKGYTMLRPLQFNDDGLVGLAKYLVKEPTLSKRWCSSKNLIQPQETKRDGQISSKSVNHIAEGFSDVRSELEKRYEGFRLIDCDTYFSEYTGKYYLAVRMRMTDEVKKKNGRL